MIDHQRKNSDSGGKKSPLPSISILIVLIFSIFRNKKDGPNLSETDIEMLLPALIINDRQFSGHSKIIEKIQFFNWDIDKFMIWATSLEKIKNS